MLSKRKLDEARINARKLWEAERALRILEGYRPCPACNASRVQSWQAAHEVDGRYYHFKRECRWCSQTTVPGYFNPTEAREYGINDHAWGRR